MLDRPKRWLTEPEYATSIHAWGAVGWLVIGSPVTLFWLGSITMWVSWMSLYAIVGFHWSTFQAAHAEQRVKDDQKQYPHLAKVVLTKSVLSTAGLGIQRACLARRCVASSARASMRP